MSLKEKMIKFFTPKPSTAQVLMGLVQEQHNDIVKNVKTIEDEIASIRKIIDSYRMAFIAMTSDQRMRVLSQIDPYLRQIIEKDLLAIGK